MTQKDDYQRLASQFVDTWQKNMAAVMNDSEFIRVFLQMMQASSFSARDNSTYGNRAPQYTTGSAAAPDAGDHAASGIKDSIAALEVRLSALERSIAQLVSSSHPKPAKRVAGTAKRSAARRGSGKRSTKKND